MTSVLLFLLFLAIDYYAILSANIQQFNSKFFDALAQRRAFNARNKIDKFKMSEKGKD